MKRIHCSEAFEYGGGCARVEWIDACRGATCVAAYFMVSALLGSGGVLAGGRRWRVACS